LTSPYTVVRRNGPKLVAVLYSKAYAEWLEPAAKKLEQAAAITTNPSLKRFLSLRAQAFRTDDYYESELAWMDLKDTPIEIAIGPYETYTDELYGAKTAFEAFVTLRNPQDSAALANIRAISATWSEPAGCGGAIRTSSAFETRSPSWTRSMAAATMCRACRRSPSTCPTTSGCASQGREEGHPVQRPRRQVRAHPEADGRAGAGARAGSPRVAQYMSRKRCSTNCRTAWGPARSPRTAARPASMPS
jgi:hypothetical protein